MPDPMGMAGVDAGAQALNNGIQNFFNARETWKASERNYQMTDYLYGLDLEQWNRQNDYNLKMWNMQNEYNSPASQMQRFKDAGLNPNLIYGQGTPGLSTPMPSAQGPKAQEANQPRAEFRLDPVSFIGMYMDIKTKEQGLKNAEQVRLNEMERNGILRAEALIKAKEAGFKDEEIEQLRKLFPVQYEAEKIKVQQAEADIIHKLAGANLSNKEIEKLQQEIDYKNTTGMFPARVPWWLQLIIGQVQGYNRDIEESENINMNRANGF